MRSSVLCRAVCTLASAAALAGPAAAADAASRSTAPYFFVPGEDGVDALPLERTRAEVQIAGTIARVELQQVYVNKGRRAIEAVYVFPASTRAAVDGLEMRIGERVVRAELRERQQARDRYDEAWREGRTASLLEQQRPNVLQMSVANIQPGDRVEVALRYTELLVPTERVYELVVPAVVGPRYTGESGAAETRGRWTANPHLHEGAPAPFSFGLDLELRAGMPVHDLWCSHDADIDFASEDVAVVHLAPSAENATRDFVLRYRLAQDAVDAGLLLYSGEDENFFLLQLEPPARPTPSQVLPRELIFIMDVSGSMGGFPIDVSKRLLRDLLAKLRPADHFNVLFFAGASALLAERSLPATPENLRRAQGEIDMHFGGGGTNLLAALERALSLPRPKGLARTLVIATDGYVAVEARAFELVRARLGEASFFAFGIGSSVNRHLIEGLAAAGKGEPFVVLDHAEAPAAAARFARYVEAPLLRDVEVAFDGLDAYDVEPPQLPDLYAERPVVLFGKYRGEPGGEVVVSGTSAERSVELRLKVADDASDPANAALRALWARHKVRRLGDLQGLEEDADRQKEITRLGLRYGLLTAYTSFVAVDTEVRGDGKPTAVRQPLPLPEGVGDLGVSGASRTNVRGLLGRGPGGGATTRGLASELRVGGGGHLSKGAARGRLVKAARRSGMRGAGHLDRAVIQKVVNQGLGSIQFCYEKELLKNSSLSGRAVFEWTISPSGKVSAVKVARSTLASAKVLECMQAVIKAWRFPPPSGGEVVVTYPFVFNAVGF